MWSKQTLPRVKSTGIEACLLLATAASLWAANPYSLPVVLKKTGPVESGKIAIPNLKAGTPYSLLFSIRTPRVFGDDSRISVDLTQGHSELMHKTLHMGDPDVFAVFHVPRDGAAEVSLAIVSKLARPATYSLEVHRWPASRNLEHEPNNRWQDANAVALGESVFGSADDVPYLPLAGFSTREVLEGETGVDWFRVEFQENRPKLVFFQVDLAERDNIPVDVAVFRVEDGKAVPYYEGEDPVTLPHEVQALPGNKFTTRILKEKGSYYIRVRANHPEYKLRTRVYDPPPYSDPQQAVQTAVDYIMGAGDSWLANTPRRGGIWDRVSNVHQETSLCVACHITHFSQRAQLYAVHNGYAVHQKQQLQFLTERFYNNPRPFYGFEQQGAVWARVISAPANVLSRMSVLLDLFEQEVSGERREWFHEGVRRYLEIYYKNRKELPPDETNGNQPLVSTYEVAWYSWRVTHDPAVAALIEQDHIKNLVDLCYQTLALADIDRQKYAAQIRRNAERILSLQRPDGQWAMRFDAKAPEVEFQTGHALWALHEAGIPASDPQVSKALHYLLERQQAFGGWMDPLQSYENFRTPFRETQMAVLALSAYYPKPRRTKGWQGDPEQLSTDPAKLLLDLDRIWDAPSSAKLEQQLTLAAASNDVLVRQQAVEALGRLASRSSLELLAVRLGDQSKVVQRTAAWAARQVYSRRKDTPAGWLTRQLASSDDRVRWGAARIFSTHFSALAHDPQVAEALVARVSDDLPTVRMLALKGLWQYWFWTPDERSKDRIEDAFLSAMAVPQHPWVNQNLREGIYNLADENIRYLYNNWVPLLNDPADRERAIRGRLAIEDRLSRKFSQVLETGSESQKKILLAGLTEFPMRRADVYDLSADHSRPAPPVYNRIGNDIEQSVFFGKSSDRFAHALLPLLDSSDPEMRRLATNATLLSRSVTAVGVNQISGEPGADHQALLQALERRRPESADIVKAFLPRRAASAGSAARSTAKTARYGKPDEAYFRAYVEPILEKRGKDGYACIHCHATHTLFNATYSTVANVVDLNDPENSLILRKPTSSAETEGTLGKGLAHGGGVRWEKNSPEYQTILNWITGAKVK